MIVTDSANANAEKSSANSSEASSLPRTWSLEPSDERLTGAAAKDTLEANRDVLMVPVGDVGTTKREECGADTLSCS